MQSLSKRITHILDRFEQTEHAFLFINAILIGIMAGFGAAGFRYLIYLFQHLFYGPFDNYLWRISEIPWYYKLLVPTVAGLILGPMIYHFRELKGHGVPEVMNAVVLKGGRLPPRAVLLKALASALTIASGGSVGREGPIVMIGSTMGSSLGQLYDTSTQRMRTFVACGAAGAIAATFNAPIAGAIFSIEVIMGEFAIEHFSPIVVSSVIATAVSHQLTGNIPSFIIPTYELISVVELGNYAVLGLAAALVALLYTNVLYKTEDLFDLLPIPLYLHPALGGLAIGTIGIFFPQVFGVGYETVDMVLSGQRIAWTFLLSLTFIKILATSITLGSGGSGGIFAPSLFIGATLGGAMGYLFQAVLPEMTAPIGAYALVGMGAMVAGTTHGPLTAILIIFEMTHDYKIILPLMIACIISTVVARSIQIDSIYTLKLVRRGINIYKGRELNVLKSLYVKEVMRTEFEEVPEHTPFSSLMDLISESTFSYFPVVNTEGLLTGIFSLNDLRRIVREEESLHLLIVAEDIAAKDVITTHPDENLSDVIKKFGRLNIEEIPVMEREGSRKVVGMIKRKDVIEAYNREMLTRELA
ncbi:MAG: chloride channel protein [Deltaproteobacteria bacterium]|nr:chloride channel protein [Candidatus Zymogenaceae bacterium]